MKKIALLVASVLVLGGFGTRAYADGVDTQTTQTSTAGVSYKAEAGITPDSLLYTIDKAIDQLRVVLASSEEKEAEVNADIAKERLGESEVMTEKGKVELALKALEEYNAKITEAASKLQAVVTNLQAIEKESVEVVTEQNTGTSTVAEDSKEAKLEESIASLEKTIQEAQVKSLVVLDSLKVLATDESVEVVEEVIEEQENHKEAVANFVKERHEFNAAKKSLNMAKVALKKVEKGGNAADIKAAQDKLASAQKEYLAAQTELQASFQAKKAADAGVAESKDLVDSKEAVQASTKETTTVEESKQTVTGSAITTTTTTTVEEKTATTEKAPVVEETAKVTEYIKTNNGNGNGNGNKSERIEKEKEDKEKEDKEKSAPGKSGEAPGKSGQSNGKKK